jgi:hypothetical protein
MTVTTKGQGQGADMRLNEREIHGATPMAGDAGSPFIVRETDDKIVLQEGYAGRMKLTATGARFLARKLNRLALRIEKRAAASADTHPQGGDVKQAPAPLSGAVARGSETDAQKEQP